MGRNRVNPAVKSTTFSIPQTARINGLCAFRSEIIMSLWRSRQLLPPPSPPRLLSYEARPRPANCDMTCRPCVFGSGMSSHSPKHNPRLPSHQRKINPLHATGRTPGARLIARRRPAALWAAIGRDQPVPRSPGPVRLMLKIRPMQASPSKPMKSSPGFSFHAWRHFPFGRSPLAIISQLFQPL